MAQQYEDSVLDFDLDFFHQTQTSNGSLTPEKVKDKNEKYRAAINVAKRKIVATDSLIKKYYIKKDELDQLEKTLYSSKEECKKVCIDFQNVTERCNRLEAEAQVLRNTNQQLQEKCLLAESRVDALQAHTHQLQTLVNENETLIQGMKVEHKLEKCNIKDYEKKLATHQKENDALMKHVYLMRDVILGRKKLNKQVKNILNKYKNDYESDDNDSVLGGVNSDDDHYFESSKSPQHMCKEEVTTLNNLATQTSKHLINYVGKVEPAVAKTDNDLDSEFNHESCRASADTGRGSSLAYSDSDKCFNSPDYFMESSPLDTNITEKIKINVVDVATSPIHVNEYVTSSTSPMAVKQSVHTATSPMSAYLAKDASDSPKQKNKHETLSGISPLTPRQVENTGESVACAYEHISEEIDNSSTIIQEYQKECLELNNSQIFDDHESRDGEIESILSKMRMTHSLITPIPSTPSRSHRPSSSCPSAAKETELCNSNFVCKDALRVKEENMILKTNIMKLASEIENIKEMLKSNNLSQQQHPKIEDTIESDYCEDDLIVVPGEFDCTGVSDSVSWNENQPNKDLIDIDSRKGIKRLEFEEPLELSSQPVEEREFEVEHAGDTNNTSQNINSPLRKFYKHRKLTKLERLRQKLIPTNNIKTNLSPLRRIKNKKAVRKINNKAAAALNNKKAYEKAVKIISELKLKEKKGNTKLVKKIEKQCFKKIDILDDILGGEIKTKTQSASSNKPTSCKEVNQECLQEQTNTGKQNRIIILEDILLTNPQNTATQDLTKTPEKLDGSLDAATTNIKLDEILDATTTNIKLDGSLDAATTKIKLDKSLDATTTKIKLDGSLDATTTKIKLDGSLDATTEKIIENETDASQCETVKENEKPFSIYSDKSIKKDCCESKKSQDTGQIVVEQENRCDMNNTKCIEIATKNNTDCSNNEPNQNTNKSIDKKDQKEIDIVQSKESCRMSIATRSRTKVVEHMNTVKDNKSVIPDKLIPQSNPQSDDCLENNKDAEINLHQRTRKRQKRLSSEKPEVECKRMLRSSASRFSSPNDSNKGLTKSLNLGHAETLSNTLPVNTKEKSKAVSKCEEEKRTVENVVSYNDIEMFGESSEANNNNLQEKNDEQVEEPGYVHPKDSILCVMIDKYGKQTMKNFSKKVPDSVINTISKTIEDEITTIIESHSKDAKKSMNKLVDKIEKLDYRPFMAGLMNYLNKPQRKLELFNKVSLPSVPPMTKPEQILLYVIAQLNKIWTSIDFVDCLLRNIEYVLFKLNQTPEFDVVESMSHFYAITCRYFKMKSRLRIFMLDAMYCIQFKAIPVIKQCMEVWMHVLPLAHMGIAKSPLVTCMVYLLHFYKCEDKFNRVQDIRFLLSRKYFFEITEWNDSKIIEMLRNAIKDVRAIPLEMKLLRIALIILAKRYGPQWCQKHIIKNLLLPMIESDAYTERVKVFCVSVLGALMKPYPVEMRVHYEIIMNMLIDMLAQNPSPMMEEAIFTSLIYMSRHSYNRVLQTLLTWKPQQISPEFENVIRDFVREKPLKTWKAILCKISVM